MLNPVIPSCAMGETPTLPVMALQGTNGAHTSLGEDGKVRSAAEMTGGGGGGGLGGGSGLGGGGDGDTTCASTD